VAFGDFDQFPNTGKKNKEELRDMQSMVTWTAPLHESMKADIERQIAMLEDNIENLKRIEKQFLGKILSGLTDADLDKYLSDNLTSVTPRQAFDTPRADGPMQRDELITIEINKIKRLRPYVFKELQKIANSIKMGWDKIDRLNKMLSDKSSTKMA